ncbi:hypothetical protein P7K49_010214, partial [Saguinus oedipus]
MLYVGTGTPTKEATLEFESDNCGQVFVHDWSVPACGLDQPSGQYMAQGEGRLLPKVPALLTCISEIPP